jgi:hypothetical protein
VNTVDVDYQLPLFFERGLLVGRGYQMTLSVDYLFLRGFIVVVGGMK